VTAEKGSKPKLSLVHEEVYRLDRRPETTSERVRRLQAEARLLAREEVEALEKSLMACVAKAEEIARGGEAYPAGVRELASRLAEDIPAKVQTMQALLERTPEPKI
jgi:hypothetical protein